MHIELDQGALDACESVNLTGLDDQDVARAGLELLTVDRPQAATLLDELDFVVRVEMRPGAGPGLSVSPAGTLSTSTSGYVDYLDGRGRWVGTGTGLPPGVVYIRRWSVEALQSDPDTLVFHVLVTTVRRDREAAAAGGHRQRRRGDALLTTLRTRRAAHS